MTNTLYIFIDESGNETQGDYYVVAGCWCLSSDTDASNVLDPTVQRLRTVAQGTFRDEKSISELKGAELPSDVLTAVIQSLEEIMYDDQTVPHSIDLPWEIQYPVRYALSNVNPQVGTRALSNFVPSKLDAPKALKLVMLVSALDPLFREGIVDMANIDDIIIVLDDTVWKNSAESAQRIFSEIDSAPNITDFKIADSNSTPGLQLADIGAYSWARHRREGDCENAIETIDNLKFAQI